METRRNMTQQTIRLYAGFGLTCLFGGLWASDALALSLPNQPASDFDMRVITFIFYVVFFGAVILSGKRGRRHNRRFLMMSCIGSLALYGIGVALLFIGIESTLYTALVLTKTLGAPLSVGIMCLCASVDREAFPRIALVGLLCAFIVKAFLMWTISKGFCNPSAILLVACVLVFMSFFICIVPFNYAGSSFFGGDQSESKDAALSPIKRSSEKLLTPSLIIGMIIASMMMGYLRSGIVGPDPHALRLVVFTLVVIVLLGSRLSVNLPWIFNGAVLCTAAGFLLGPSLAHIVLDAPAALCGIGSTLFETIMLTLVVWATRNGSDPLRSAAGSLLVVITGHLCGALIAQSSILVFGNELAFHEGSLILVFFYVVMLVLLFRSTSLHLPFLPQNFDDLENARPAEEEDSALLLDEKEGSNTSEPRTDAFSLPLSEQNTSYWDQPCACVARMYQLTPREIEVLEQLARGRDLSFMETKFMLSRNTVKMHIKHLYTKLDVHSKQEVIDLVDEARKIV